MKNWCRVKPKVNLLIDIIMMIFMMALAGIGFMIKYLLLPGYKVNEVYGDNAELFFMGLDRHQWGAIHLYVALFLVFLILLHIVLHWDMIVNILEKMVKGRGARRIILTIVGLVSLILVLVPFVLKPQVRVIDRPHHHSRSAGYETSPSQRFSGAGQASETTEHGNAALTTGEAEYEYPGTATGTKKGYELSTNSEDYPDEKREHHYDELNLDGTMTLNQVSEQFNISTDQLAGVIGVPVSRSGERLGRLRKIYGFDLNELREYIIKQGKDK